MFRARSSLFPTLTATVALVAVAVAPIAAQLDPCFEECHSDAMEVYEEEGYDAASEEFDDCMEENCGGM